MKILMLTNNLDLPEAHLILGLKERGVQIKLIMHKNSPFQDVLINSGIETEYWNFKGRIDLKSVFYIRKILAQDNYDIIHTFSARALTSSLIASSFKQIKHVTYRGTTGHLSRWDPASWLGYLNPKVSKVICVSDAVKKYLLVQGIAAGKLTRIYKGHEETWYKNTSVVSREELNLLHDDFLVACSANMRPVKGVDILIKAFESLPDDFAIKGVLIGEIRDSQINRLLNNPKLKDRFVLTGFRKDAAAIVSICDAFCMPSRKREGLPKALIEAMIQSVPAIITNVGGMPELITNEVHGLIVSEENPAELSKAIIRLYTNRQFAKNLADAARIRILNEFTILNTISDTIKVYHEVLSC